MGTSFVSTKSNILHLTVYLMIAKSTAFLDWEPFDYCELQQHSSPSFT